jgi:hypothetical protein
MAQNLASLVSKGDGDRAQRDIPAAIVQIQSALSTLESNTECLRDRLTLVLSSEPPSGNEGKARQVHSVPMAEELTRIVERIESLNDRVLSTLDRLHV